MALPTNTFRPKRYFRSKFKEGKFLLAAEASDIQLELQDLIREFNKSTYGDMAVQVSFQAEQDANNLVIRPGEAWNDGIPFVMKSGTDPKVIAGVLPAGVSMSDRLASTSDSGGKDLNLSGLADGSYSVVIEATEELIRPTGTGAVDNYLEGANVGEETSNKLRFIYKVNIIDTADLVSTPTYPLAISNHFINEIVLTPSGTENFIVSAIDITQDPNGADRRITLDNSASEIPFSSPDVDEFINGILQDSDGNEYHITSMLSTDGGATVQILLDREIDYNASVPKAGLPVITSGVNFKLRKRDFYVTATTGTPLGRHYYRVADFVFAASAITSLSDLRTVTAINSFGIDHNVRLVDGGIITWESGTGILTHDSDFQITVPGIVGRAVIQSPPGTHTLSTNGDVAFFFLDREATSDYNVTLTVLAKENVPANVNTYIFAERRADRIYFPHGGSIGSAETGILGAFGGVLNKDLSEDLIIDALSENQMDEVFAETFNTQASVDLVNSSAMTFEPFAKQYKATAAARFVDYNGDTVPSSDPTNPWTNLGSAPFHTGKESIAAGVLSLNDDSIGDRLAYERIESSLVSMSHSDHKIRLRVPSSGGTPPPFLYELEDGSKHFSLAITSTGVELRDGIGSVLSSFVVSTSTYHEYRLVKIGEISVQYYVDNVLRGSIPYSSISTASVNTKTTWGTTTLATATIDIDYLNFNIYGSILQSIDIFRTAGLKYDADLLPDAGGLGAEAWTLNGGGGGIVPSVSNSILNIIDPAAGAQLNYERTESLVTKIANAQIEMRMRVNSGPTASFDRYGVRIRDGRKDVALYVRDDTGQLKVGLYDGASGTLISSEVNIPTDSYFVIKLLKDRDVGYSFYVDGVFQDQNAYSEFTDTTLENKYLFGSFNDPMEYDVDIDYVQYSLPGQGDLTATPVRDFLTIVNSDDPFPISWISSDSGKIWHEMLPGSTTSIATLDDVGANVLIRVMLSTVGSALTDYGILYNLTAFDVNGQFEYAKQTATAGQTVFSLPFTFTPGVNELQVHYRPLATGLTRKLTRPEDYTEPNESSVELTFPTLVGDILEFRNSFTKDPIVPPAVRFLQHNHDGSRGEDDEINPTRILMAVSGADVELSLPPVGVILPHYDFNGIATFNSGIWKFCDGSLISDAASPVDGETLPDMSNRYLVGFGTEAGGDIDSAAWATPAVGNISHLIDISHIHTTASAGSHSHTVDSHTHNMSSGGVLTDFFSLANGATAVYAHSTNGGPIVGFTAGTAPGTNSTGSHSHTVNSSGSAAQTIQPRSIRVRYIMRIK